MYVLEEKNIAGEWQPVCTNYDSVYYIWQTYTDFKDAVKDFKDFLKDPNYRLAFYERKSIVDTKG